MANWRLEKGIARSSVDLVKSLLQEGYTLDQYNEIKVKHKNVIVC